MKILKYILASIIAGLAITIIIQVSNKISSPENNIYNLNKYKILTMLTLIWLLLILVLVALYLLPFLIKIINLKFKSHQQEKNKPINLLIKAHKNKIIEELKNLNQIEKFILNKYYISPNKLHHKFNENFQEFDVLNNLCDKIILYKPHDYDDLYIDNYGIKYYKFFINDIAKEYLNKHPKLLK